MGGLNVHGDDQNSVSASQKKKWNKSPKLVIGLAVLIAIPIIGTTLAGQVNVNVSNNNNVTFGQGFSTALPCDTDVLVTPYAEWYSGSWYLSRVEISSLDTTDPIASATPGAGCLNQHITLTATDASGVAIANSDTTFSVTGESAVTNTGTGNHKSTWGGNGETVTLGSAGLSVNTTVVITYPSDGVSLTTNNVSGFTLQEN
jgi:hypothetical protein